MKLAKISSLLFKWITTLTLLMVSSVVVVGLWVVIKSPNVDKIKDCMTTKNTQILVCEQNPDYVPLSAISPELVDAIVYSEDAKFFEHNGFDVEEIFNSLVTNIKDLSYHRGASTITQQLVKNLFLTPEKTWMRKLNEAYITIHVENLLTKNQILEKYLNVIEMGPNIYGIRNASKYYFDKEPLALNLLESASLAYLLPNPKLYSKVFQTGELTKFAAWRLEGILDSLKLHRKISNEVHDLAVKDIENFPAFSAIVATEQDVDEELESNQENSEGSLFPDQSSKKRQLTITDLEPGQQIESIDKVSLKGDSLGFFETHLNRDEFIDTILIEDTTGDSGRSQAYLFLGKGSHYVYLGSIWINPVKFLVEPHTKKEFSSIYTFVPGDSVSGDLLIYQYNGGQYRMKSETMERTEASHIFKNTKSIFQEI